MYCWIGIHHYQLRDQRKKHPATTGVKKLWTHAGI
jgi:hypothetical protein